MSLYQKPCSLSSLKILFRSSSVIPPKRVAICAARALLDRPYSIICGAGASGCSSVSVCLTCLYLKKPLGLGFLDPWLFWLLFQLLLFLGLQVPFEFLSVLQFRLICPFLPQLKHFPSFKYSVLWFFDSWTQSTSIASRSFTVGDFTVIPLPWSS